MGSDQSKGGKIFTVITQRRRWRGCLARISTPWQAPQGCKHKYGCRVAHSQSHDEDF